MHSLLVYLAAAFAAVASLSAEQPPIIHSVLNTAGRVEGPIARGSLIVITGERLCVTSFTAKQFPLRPNLAGTNVVVDGIPAPVLSVSPREVTAFVPWEAWRSNSADGLLLVQIRVDDPPATLQSNTVAVKAALSAPGIFTVPWTGREQAVAIIAGTTSFAAKAQSGELFEDARPAKAGEIIEVYMTGLGPVTNRPPSGWAALVNPLSLAELQIGATIGGVPAEVTFAGLAPKMAGVYQVNVRIPSLESGGEAVPLVIFVEDHPSNTATIAVE